MKKFLALLTSLCLAGVFLTACGTSVFDDLENFINVEMKDVNENYDKIKEEAALWENIEEDAELEESINSVLLPLVNDSLEKLEKITPETEEVKELKNKYVEVMKAYKQGFEDVLDGVQTVDEDKMYKGNEEIEKGIKLLDEYNSALEELAKEVDAELEY